MIPELPAHLRKMGGGQYIGYIIALFTFTAGLARPFSGKLTDTIGRVPVMAFGSIVCFICGFFYPIVLSISGFLWLRFIHGMSTGTKPTATSAYVADIIPVDRRGEAMGTLGLFTATGMSIGPSIGSWFTTSFGINSMFYLSSAFALLSIVILANMKETLSVKQRFSFKLFILKKDEFFEMEVIAPFLVCLLLSFGSGVVITLIPDLGNSLGVANKGLFFTVYTVVSVVMRLFFSKSSDKYGRIFMLIIASVFLVLGMLSLAFTHSIFMFFVSSLLFGVTAGLSMPNFQAWTADLSREENRGKAMGTMYIALELGIGLGAYFGGELFNFFKNGMQIAFLLSALFAFFSLLYLIRLKKRASITLQQPN